MPVEEEQSRRIGQKTVAGKGGQDKEEEEEEEDQRAKQVKSKNTRRAIVG